jgi:hypothetical protein
MSSSPFFGLPTLGIDDPPPDPGPAEAADASPVASHYRDEAYKLLNSFARSRDAESLAMADRVVADFLRLVGFGDVAGAYAAAKGLAAAGPVDLDGLDGSGDPDDFAGP